MPLNVRCTVKKNSEFRRLYARGKSAVTPCLVVYCRHNGTDRNRVGFTVSTKLGHACTRNRVRRRLREIFRLNSPRLKPGWDIVVVARTRSVNAKYSTIDAAFMEASAKLGLVK